MVARLQSDGHEGELVPIVDSAFGHERDRNRDAQGVGQLAQCRSRSPSPNAIASKDDGSLGRLDEPGGMGDGRIGGLMV